MIQVNFNTRTIAGGKIRMPGGYKFGADAIFGVGTLLFVDLYITKKGLYIS